MEEADQLCNRVAIIDHGKILALDTPAALKRSVGADTIVTVKTSARSGGRRRSPLERDRWHHAHARDRRRRRAACHRAPSGSCRVVVTATESGGFDVVDLTVAEPTLETVFINLTGKELRE